MWARFKNDTDPRKINLGIDAYRTEEGKPYILDVVKEAEATLLQDSSLNKEYLPINGDKGSSRPPKPPSLATAMSCEKAE